MTESITALAERLREYAEEAKDLARHPSGNGLDGYAIAMDEAATALTQQQQTIKRLEAEQIVGRMVERAYVRSMSVAFTGEEKKP